MRSRILVLAFSTLLLLLAAACGSNRATAPDSEAATTPFAVSAATDVRAVTTTTTLPQGTKQPTTTEAATTSTTTRLPPTTDPTASPSDLVITEPRAGAHVGDVWCPFRGVTDPGVELLAAGQYPIEVAADGSWSTVLRLNPGGNVAVFTATDESGTTTEARVAVYYDPPLELRADGLGDWRFDDPMDTVMAGLIQLIGAPTSEHILTRADLPEDDPYGIVFGLTGYPSVDYYRSARWDTLGLEVMFSDYEPEDWPYGSGPVVFNGWITRDPGEYGATLRTGAGAGYGTSLTELEAMYDDALHWSSTVDELTGEWHFNIDSGIPGVYPAETRRWFGHFDSDPTQSPTVIEHLSAGWGYDSC